MHNNAHIRVFLLANTRTRKIQFGKRPMKSNKKLSQVTYEWITWCSYQHAYLGFPQIQSHQPGLMGYQGNGIIICRHSAIAAFSRLNWIFAIQTQFVIWNCCFIRFQLTPLRLAEWTRGNIENKTVVRVHERPCVCVWVCEQMKTKKGPVCSDLVDGILFETILCFRWELLIDNKLFPLKREFNHKSYKAPAWPHKWNLLPRLLLAG